MSGFKSESEDGKKSSIPLVTIQPSIGFSPMFLGNIPILNSNNTDNPLSETSFTEDKESTVQFIQNSIRNSTIYTNLSSDSSRCPLMTCSRSSNILSYGGNTPENLNHRSQRQISLSDRSVQASLYKSTIGHISMEFCNVCGRETTNIIRFKFKALGLWRNIIYIFSSLKCCSDPLRMTQYQEATQTCVTCGSMKKHLSN